MNPDQWNAAAGPGGCLAEALTEGEEAVFRVAGNCMEPEVDNLAAVRVKRTRFLVPGDVVAYRDPQSQRLVVHRVLGYVRRRGEWKLLIKADRGAGPDPLVEASCVLGKPIARNGRACPVSLAKRLQAIGQYAACCLRWFIRRAFR
jgi:signal peptidase I